MVNFFCFINFYFRSPILKIESDKGSNFSPVPPLLEVPGTPGTVHLGPGVLLPGGGQVGEGRGGAEREELPPRARLDPFPHPPPPSLSQLDLVLPPPLRAHRVRARGRRRRGRVRQGPADVCAWRAVYPVPTTPRRPPSRVGIVAAGAVPAPDDGGGVPGGGLLSDRL